MEDIYEMMMNEEEDYDAAYEDGVTDGKVEGATQEKNSIAKSMLDKNLDINLISEITKLSISEINSLI